MNAESPAQRTSASARPAKVWIMAARPRTLPAAVIPVIVGLALAHRVGPVDWRVAAATMAAALLIQIGTNIANDYYDFVAGADDEKRLGPLRITQAGLVKPAAVRNAAFATLGAAAALGLYLVAVGGWPILVVGALSIVCAIAYTAGPWPLGYLGLGDLFVFVFFGLIAVNGTMYLQTGRLSLLGLVVSLPVACTVTAILVVNNLRDIATDALAGKRTLAVRIGERATRLEYHLLVTAAFVLVPVVASIAGGWPLIALGALPLGVIESRALAGRHGVELNLSLAATARLHLVFGALLSLGLVL